MKNSSTIVREAISQYIEEMPEEKISQKDLKTVIQKKLGKEIASGGTLSNVLSKYNSIGELAIPIKNVEVIQEANKPFYKYKNDAAKVSESQFAMDLFEATINFEATLKEDVLNISFIDLNQEERKLLYKYTEKLEELKRLFQN